MRHRHLCNDRHPYFFGETWICAINGFLDKQPFVLLFDEKKQADVNSHGIEYASVKECKEISQI